MKRKITALLVMIMMVINSGLISSAEEIRGKNPQQQVESIEAEIGNTGLMGYYYFDNAFQDIAMIQPVVNGELDVPQDLDIRINSAYWYGYFVPEQSGKYEISTSNENAIVKIDGQDIAGGIELEENEQYQVSISYVGNGDILTRIFLYWKTPINTNKMNIPNNRFSLPTFNNDVNDEISPLSISSLSANPFSDADNDSIPDNMETNGFCLIPDDNGVPRLVAWNDSYNGRYIKYVTSPNKWSTDDDPYSDYMETSKINMDPNVNARASHPLVAAYPVISASVEKFNISMNRDVNNQEGSASTVSITTDSGGSKTITNEHSHSISQTAKIGTDGIGVSASHSHSYTHSEANTTTWNTSNQNSNEKSWTTTIGMNQAINAYFGINVRFNNMGTAPIYQSRPVMSLVLEDGRVDNTLYTINQLASRVPDIMPNSSYPTRGQAAIAMNTYDEGGSQVMTLNKDNVKALQDAGSFRVETNQLRGKIAYYDNNGNITTRNEWANYIVRINSTTAKLILDSKETGVQVRNVAAKGDDSSNPVSISKPDITLREALKLAYGAVESGNNLVLNGYTIDKSNVVIGFPNDTRNQLSSQSGKEFLDMLLRPGMKIYIKFLDPNQSNIKVPKIEDIYMDYGFSLSDASIYLNKLTVFRLGQQNPYAQIKNFKVKYTELGVNPVSSPFFYELINDTSTSNNSILGKNFRIRCKNIGIDPTKYARNEYISILQVPFANQENIEYITTQGILTIEYVGGKVIQIPTTLRYRNVFTDASFYERDRQFPSSNLRCFYVLDSYTVGNASIDDTYEYTTVNNSVKGTGYNQFNFSDGWSFGNNGAYHNGDYATSDTRNATVQFKFIGEKIEVFGWKGVAEGRAKVYIDGREVADISNTPAHGASEGRDVLYSSHKLLKGEHTLTIKVLGEYDNPSGYNPSHKNVTIDYVKIGRSK